MIKKSISGILILLIFINSLGCYSKAFVPKTDINKLSEGDKITVIANDMKAYNITVKSVEGSEIHGFEYSGEQKSMVVIHAKDVSFIEIDQLDVGLIILAGCVCLGAIIFKGVIIPVPPF